MIELDSHDLLIKRAVRQKAAGIATTVLSAGAAAYGIAASSLTSIPWFLAGITGLVIGPMIYASAGRDPNTRAHKGGRIRFEPEQDAIFLSRNNRRIQRSEIDGAWVEEDYLGGTLVIETTDGTTVAARFVEEQRATVDRMLEGLGADARVVMMRVAASERGGRGCASGCMMLAVLVGIAPTIVMFVAIVKALLGDPTAADIAGYLMIPAVICISTALLAARSLSSTKIRIGADGVRVGRRFMPYGELRAATHVENGVLFETERDAIKVRCLGIQAATVIHRVDQALERFRSGAELADLRLLDRAQRSVADWRAALTQVLDRGSYRTRALDKSDLLRVIENPSAPAERRAGAILALSPHGDESDRKRVRIAYEACAEQHTRAAMEAALEEELEDMERALKTGQSR